MFIVTHNCHKHLALEIMTSTSVQHMKQAYKNSTEFGNVKIKTNLKTL